MLVRMGWWVGSDRGRSRPNVGVGPSTRSAQPNIREGDAIGVINADVARSRSQRVCRTATYNKPPHRVLHLSLRLRHQLESPQTTTLVRTSPASSHRTTFRVRDLAIVRCVYKTLRSLCAGWPVRRVSGKREGRREKDRRTGLERSHSRCVTWVMSTTRRTSKSSPTVSEAPWRRPLTTTIIGPVPPTFPFGVA